jgi:hypothetical protein
MTLHQTGIRGDATPEAALAAIRAFGGPVLVDLDETLYLRSSTEDFIDSARPALLALILLRLLDLAQPWRWTGGQETRDVWRAGLVRTLFPWVMPAWRRRVQDLAARFGNEPLIAAVKARGQLPIVVTVGFRPIAEPMIAALGFAGARIVAARMWRFADRRRGKLSLAHDALGSETVRRSLVITDSLADAQLLDACALPLRTVWPAARYRPAFAHAYLPGRYLARVKRPGQHYFSRCVVRDEFPIWVLASITLSAVPVLHVGGLLLLLISFWAIYEQGYVDNDHVASRHEADPVLSVAFWTDEVATSGVAPWIWAAASGAAAIFLLRAPAHPSLSDFLAWAAVLVATSVWFRLYNRLDKDTRVWLFWGLPLARGTAFATVVAIVPVAQMAIGAHVLAKWIEYLAYRREGRWPDVPTHLVRLVIFVVLCSIGLVAGTASPASIAMLFLAFFAFKARHDLVAASKKATRLDREPVCKTAATVGPDRKPVAAPVLV